MGGGRACGIMEVKALFSNNQLGWWGGGGAAGQPGFYMRTPGGLAHSPGTSGSLLLVIGHGGIFVLGLDANG